MRYIDSGNRNASEALGSWLQTETASGVTEFRWQTVFFSQDGLAPLVPMLQQLLAADLPTFGVIGSNDGETLESHTRALVNLLGLPRSNARLGIVGYSGAYFHPKTYHFLRADGSQAAYVGSANLTLAGMARHVEAGLILDTRDGDSASVLDDIANGVNAWFNVPHRSGFEQITDANDIARIVSLGLLATAPPPRVSSAGGNGNAGIPGRPGLKSLASFPAVSGTIVGGAAGNSSNSAIPAPAVTVPTVVAAAGLNSVPTANYPSYIRSAPGALSPTNGGNALTGTSLPNGSTGLIVRLNRDSTRHWHGRDGTANISIPVATLPTIRFGLYQGKYARPRAEFELQMRFLHQGGDYRASPASTNIMPYGGAPGESGHADTRFLVPKPPALEIRSFANANGILVPDDGDLAILEWPIAARPSFLLSLIERSTPLHTSAAAAMATATTNGAIVGQGACWLPAGLSPAW